MLLEHQTVVADPRTTMQTFFPLRLHKGVAPHLKNLSFVQAVATHLANQLTHNMITEYCFAGLL